MKRTINIVLAALLLICGSAQAQKRTIVIEPRKNVDTNPHTERILNDIKMLGSALITINNHYVDTIDSKKMVDSALEGFVKTLDPHSVYIPADRVKMENESLNGSFEGIGIEFAIISDTLTIQNVISGGPSEAVGLCVGDKIIEIDGENVASVKLTNDDVRAKLRGPKGTKVKVRVLRYNQSVPLDFEIVRNKIPLESIDAAYQTPEGVFYVKLGRFAADSYMEFLRAFINKCPNEPAGLILDLRGNGGGYLNVALSIANSFLEEKQSILYTEGLHEPVTTQVADGTGFFRNRPLVLLVDENSASASEIVAGAIQDWDRGVIIGRRSFGKGLVQQPMEFRDGSVVRLTIARYYTPSGRCIQKPYAKGHGEDYEKDLLMRYERGEFFNEDSIKQDGPEFKTTLGRVVYGGGGIRPDIFVPEDSTNITSYYKQAAYTGLIPQFCFEVVDNNRQKLNKMKSGAEIVKWMDGQGLLEKFAQYGQEHGLQRRNLMLARSTPLFRRAIYSGIIYNAMDMKEYLQFLNQDDPAILRSLEIIREGKTFPEKP